MKKKAFKMLLTSILWLSILGFTACGKNDNIKDNNDNMEDNSEKNTVENVIKAVEQTEEPSADNRLIESARDGNIDFEVVQAYNPDIFAWLYVPGTDIDLPVLQSGIADDYYAEHNMDGSEGAAGALYTEMANLMNMCDFNTIIHGKDMVEGDLFYDLHRFENPDFFLENHSFYIYLPDNVLTYEIVTAYYDEGSDLLRRYDYTTLEGCQNYLDQMYSVRDIAKNQREDWEGLSPYHFLVTLDGSIREDSQTQYVVIGALVKDETGVIDRVILD